MSAKRPNASASAKKAAPPPQHYALGDIVLGKVRGYAPWPGMVVDPDNVPSSVSADRPASKKTTFYCVRFFPNNDYAWLIEKDISRLKPHEIEAYIAEPAKKKADLLEAYRIAQDPSEWIAEKDRAVQEQADEAAAAEVDQLDSDTAASTKSKKRKRDESASAKVSTAKKSAKKEATKSSSAKKASASAKGRKKSKTAVESEDEADGEADENGPSASGAEDAGPSKKASPPPAKKQKKGDGEDGEEAKEDPEAVKVRDWRHKLQKTFLGKVPPKAEDMPAIDELFKTVESTENITIEQLQFSKIGKVMRHIAALPPAKVPEDATFKFRERAKALVERWHAILSASKATNGEKDEKNKENEDEKKANGAVKDIAKAIDSKEGSKEAKAEDGEKDGEGEVEEDAVVGGTAKIDLNGAATAADAPAAHAPTAETKAGDEVAPAPTSEAPPADVEMADA